jgi:beta-galactosidase
MTKGALPTPIWFNEFTAGGGGFYGAPGRSRTYADLGLLMGAQGVLAWTSTVIGAEKNRLYSGWWITTELLRGKLTSLQV